MMLKWLLAAALFAVTAQVSAEETTPLKTPKEKFSYGIGTDLGRNLKRLGIEVDADLLLKGFNDAL